MRRAQRWVAQFWPTAKKAGISRSVYNSALGNFTPDPDVLSKAGIQAEFVKPLWEYLDSAISQKRLENGQRRAPPIWPPVAAASRRPMASTAMSSSRSGAWNRPMARCCRTPKIVKNTIRSLATLAYQGGSRAKYGRQQLIAALKILQRGDIDVRGMTGSWAGAMGHTQFIPTTYQGYAVDFDGDGRRDIWNSEVDALASTANYLAKMGWRRGQTWGYEVELPARLRLAARQMPASPRPLGQWRKMGVRRVAGRPVPRDRTIPRRLYAPAGAGGPAFLLLHNFRVIKRYNNADAYALAVGHLSDRLRGGGDFVSGWPRDVRPLARAERAEMQALLARHGFYSGHGRRQDRRRDHAGDPLATSTGRRRLPDGYASTGLLQQLRSGG